jgi:hypothetical protein
MMTMDEMERRYIEEVLRRADGKITGQGGRGRDPGPAPKHAQGPDGEAGRQAALLTVSKRAAPAWCAGL